MVRRPLPCDHSEVGEGARGTKEERSAPTQEGAKGPEFGWGDGGSQASTLWILLELEYSVKDRILPSRVLD